MAEVTWANLAKSVDDNTKISAEIDADVFAHNEDPSAHGQLGEGIYNHRIAEILDHLDGSIQQKKISIDELQIYTCFESLDGWNKSGDGTITNKLLGTQLATGGVINTEVYIYDGPVGVGGVSLLNKNSFFQTAVKLGSASNVLVYFLRGEMFDDVFSAGFGFMIEDGILYAITIQEGNIPTDIFKTEITGITLTDLNIYRAVWDYDNSKVRFYVNGVLKHTEITNLPVGGGEIYFHYYIKNKIALNKTLGSAYLLSSRDL